MIFGYLRDFILMGNVFGWWIYDYFRDFVKWIYYFNLLLDRCDLELGSWVFLGFICKFCFVEEVEWNLSVLCIMCWLLLGSDCLWNFSCSWCCVGDVKLVKFRVGIRLKR